MNYSEKLKDPRWQKRRLEILNRDKFGCRLCTNKDLTLHVHHLRYVNGIAPWEYPSDDLMTLCANCHGAVHSEDSPWLKMCIRKEVESGINGREFVHANSQADLWRRSFWILVNDKKVQKLARAYNAIIVPSWDKEPPREYLEQKNALLTLRRTINQIIAGGKDV